MKNEIKLTQTDIDELAEMWDMLELLESKLMCNHCCLPDKYRGKKADQKRFWLRHLKDRCESIANLADKTLENMK